MKIALTLAGGGSKGSYEMGAWQALNELNKEFHIVTGTSIGALNGGMMVQGEYQRCYDLWQKINIDNVLYNGFEIENFNLKQILKTPEFKTFLHHYIRQFKTDITPFKHLMEDYIKPDLIRNSEIIFGVNVSKFPKIKKEEVVLNELSDSDIKHYLLASCSIFPVFPICRFHGKQYIDGGYSDNLPIDFAFKLGANKVIAIDLNHNITHKHYLNHEDVSYIYPKWDLGSFLYFDRDFITRNRMLGYYDVYKYFGYYDGFKFTFIKNEKNNIDASKITNIILEDDTKYNELNLKNYIKIKGYENTYSYLNKHLKEKIKDYDYYLKTLEELLVIFDYNINDIYEVIDIVKDLENKIKEINYDEYQENLNLIKSISKKREYINNTNKKEFVSLIYNKQYDYEFKMFIKQTNVELYLAMIFIEEGFTNEI